MSEDSQTSTHLVRVNNQSEGIQRSKEFVKFASHREVFVAESDLVPDARVPIGASARPWPPRSYAARAKRWPAKSCRSPVPLLAWKPKLKSCNAKGEIKTRLAAQ